MGKVAIILRVMPEDPDNVDAIVEKINELKPNTVDIEDIGFGIRAVKVSFIVPDTGGASDKVEEDLKNIPGVSEVDTLSVDLIS